MDTRRLDLNLLVTLEALLAERNVTRAAARLHLSQPAVSAQLGRLRAVFDDPLLVPARRGMIPTAKAEALQAPLRRALAGVREAVEVQGAFDPGRARMTLSIACTDYTQAAIVRPLLLALRAQAPGIRVAVRDLDPVRLAERMAGGDVDLALMIPAAAPPELHVRPLFGEDYVLVARRGHPRLDGRRKLTLAGFAALEHVVVSLRGGDFTTAVDTVLAARGVTRNVVLSVPSFLFQLEVVAGSDLVALVPRRLLDDRGAGLQVLDCPFPVAGFGIGMAWHARCHGHDGHRWIRALLASLVEGGEAGR